MQYEAVIGLEVHVQLKVNSKMFTRSPYRYGEPPNTLANAVIMALPGTLPVMNEDAIYKSIQVGMLFGCEIAEECKWDRKNYFYPDSPKNYQISQYDRPICLGGTVEIELPGPSRNVMGEHREVQLTRIHLEEDAGKLTHYDTYSLVDYNRAGSALIEIVTEPDMHTGDEVFAFLTALRQNIVNAGLSDCDMEKGQLRCDANVSIRPEGETSLGTKVEIKNLNTISGVRNGVIHEIKRQIQATENGERIIQETRLWNAEQGVTTSMRSKEEAHDYRYFPDPDLMPVRVEPELKERLRAALPELIFDRQRRFMEQYELPYTVTSVICPDLALSHYFEEAVHVHNNPKAIANYVANDLLRELGAAEGEGALPLDQCKITPTQLAGLVRIIDEGIISKQIAKDVFIEMFQTGQDAEAIVEAKGLKQSSDTGELEAMCREVIAENPKPVEQFKAGKEQAINALKGQIMKRTKGSANPQVVDEVMRKLLAE